MDNYCYPFLFDFLINFWYNIQAFGGYSMMNISSDYLASRAIISGMDLSRAGYDKIYFETNENLVDMYNKVNTPEELISGSDIIISAATYLSDNV